MYLTLPSIIKMCSIHTSTIAHLLRGDKNRLRGGFLQHAVSREHEAETIKGGSVVGGDATVPH
jgi:hypothetical protein